MNLPREFDPAEWKRQLDVLDSEVYKKQKDVEITSGDANRQQRLVLRSPDGTRWSVTVDNMGVLSATAM